MEYKYQIDYRDVFKVYMYVPEEHPKTGVTFDEREDEGHVFKVHMTV